MADRIPSVFLLVPGPWTATEQVVQILAATGEPATARTDEPIQAGAVRVEVVNDDALASGFSWGRDGPQAPPLVQAVGACDHAAIVEIAGTLDQDPQRVARIGEALRRAGGVAVRMEASGAASDWDTWLERLRSGHPADLYRAAVLLVQQEDGALYTCGMHAFDLPDAQITDAPYDQAVRWLDILCVYQLAEDPALGSGHTFRPDADAERLGHRIFAVLASVP